MQDNHKKRSGKEQLCSKKETREVELTTLIFECVKLEIQSNPHEVPSKQPLINAPHEEPLRNPLTNVAPH